MKTMIRLLVLGLLGSVAPAGAGEVAAAAPAAERPLQLRFQARERFEIRDNWLDFDSGGDLRDDSALLQRLRVGFDWRPQPGFALTLEAQDSRTFFDSPGGPATREFVEPDNPLDLRLAYLAWSPAALDGWTLTLGRQVLAFGDQRLVGGFEWSNLARTFDAGRATWKSGNLTLDAFAGMVTLHESREFDPPDDDDWFGGLHAAWREVAGGELSLYLFGRAKGDVKASSVFTSAANQEEGNPAPEGDHATLGARWAGPLPWDGWDLRLEAAGQAGTLRNPAGFGSTLGGRELETGGQDLLAGALHVQVGRGFAAAAWQPRVFAEYNFASGDGDPGDGDSRTFQNLFPTNHYHYGTLDRFAWQNIHDLALGVKALPVDGLTLELAGHAFWLADTNDVWRFAGQGPVGGAGRYGRALAGDPGSQVGYEIDLTARYAPHPRWALEGGYAYFFAGDYIRDTSATGAADDAQFGYLQVQFTY
jgi:hypothetical protein